MEIAISGWDFAKRSPEEFLEFAQSIDVKHIEFWPWNRPAGGLEELRDLLATRGMSVACVNTTSNRRLLVHDVSEVGQIIRDSIDAAVALNAPFVNFYPGHRADLDT